MQIAGAYPTSVLLYYVILWQNITIVFPVISYYFGEKMFQLCKMQIACLIMLIFSGLNYIREGKGQVCNRYFDWVFILAEITVFFDGFSVVTVNYLVISHRSINVFIHFMFLASLDAFFLHGFHLFSFPDRCVWEKPVTCGNPSGISSRCGFKCCFMHAIHSFCPGNFH